MDQEKEICERDVQKQTMRDYADIKKKKKKGVRQSNVARLCA